VSVHPPLRKIVYIYRIYSTSKPSWRVARSSSAPLLYCTYLIYILIFSNNRLYIYIYCIDLEGWSIFTQVLYIKKKQSFSFFHWTNPNTPYFRSPTHTRGYYFEDQQPFYIAHVYYVTYELPRFDLICNTIIQTFVFQYGAVEGQNWLERAKRGTTNLWAVGR